MTMVHGSKQLGARLHQWHAGMDAIYAVGSQFYAGRPAPLRDVKEALRLLEQEHRNRKATKLRADAVTHLNAVIADLHDAMWSAIGEHGDPDAGTGYPRENPGRYVMDMTRIPIGSMVLFGGQRWLVDDVHGYPTKTVDLRRSIIVDPKRRYLDGAEFRRGVPVKHLDDYEAYIEANEEPRENPDTLFSRAAAQAGHPLSFRAVIMPPPPIPNATWGIYSAFGNHNLHESSEPNEKEAIKAAFRLAKVACRDPNASDVTIVHAGRTHRLDSDCELSTSGALSLLAAPASRSARRGAERTAKAADRATGHARAAAAHVAGNVSRGAGIIWRKLRGARANPAPIVRQRVTELLPDVVIHYTAHGVWLRGMPRSYRGPRLWSASGVDEAREMAAYLARGLRETGAARSIEIAQGSPEKARRSR